MHNTFD
ncbi:hypothetical protein D039_3160A, partial [Vibrio parahaemolyticus EKP-028]